MKSISKSKIKPSLLKVFRDIEKTGEEVVVTDQGKPVLKIIRYSENPEGGLMKLKDTVLKYDDPTAPVGVDDWEALK
ncbi:MAG TPA: type II toxin-antitoxin system Phd/YefM family antitoxin [Spirochaetota bacterium]|nr:type II toxin-antitoxin system Phd/YefM family antitoxin [Spirochaetota bacterium]